MGQQFSSAPLHAGPAPHAALWYLGIYAGISGGQTLFQLTSTYLLKYLSVVAARSMHNNMLSCLIRYADVWAGHASERAACTAEHTDQMAESVLEKNASVLEQSIVHRRPCVVSLYISTVQHAAHICCRGGAGSYHLTAVAC